MVGSRWRVLAKCGPLEKGMANHFSILALRSPWTVWTCKNTEHWKVSSPGRYCTSLVAHMVKRLPTMREAQVQSLGWENLLEKEMATHSGIVAWKIPWMEVPGRLQSMGVSSLICTWKLRTFKDANVFFYISCCTILLCLSRFCTVILKMFYFLFFMYYFCEKCYKPTIALHS